MCCCKRHTALPCFVPIMHCSRTLCIVCIIKLLGLGLQKVEKVITSANFTAVHLKQMDQFVLPHWKISEKSEFRSHNYSKSNQVTA